MLNQNQIASSSDDDDKYSSDPEINEVESGPAPPSKSSNDYEDSPRVKVGESDRKRNSDDDNDQYPEQSIDIDEDHMIDVAEKIFIRIADEIIKQKVTVRQVLNQHIFLADIDGQQYELLSPEGLIDSITDLGIQDLKEVEIQCLLKVLSKPELEGAILI